MNLFTKFHNLKVEKAFIFFMAQKIKTPRLHSIYTPSLISPFLHYGGHHTCTRVDTTLALGWTSHLH